MGIRSVKLFDLSSHVLRICVSSKVKSLKSGRVSIFRLLSVANKLTNKLWAFQYTSKFFEIQFEVAALSHPYSFDASQLLKITKLHDFATEKAIQDVVT